MVQLRPMFQVKHWARRFAAALPPYPVGDDALGVPSVIYGVTPHFVCRGRTPGVPSRYIRCTVPRTTACRWKRGRPGAVAPTGLRGRGGVCRGGRPRPPVALYTARDLTRKTASRRWKRGRPGTVAPTTARPTSQFPSVEGCRAPRGGVVIRGRQVAAPTKTRAAK